MKRGKGPKRWTRMRPVNPERKAQRFTRSYGSKERVEWIKTLPCTIAHCRETPSVNAHVGGVTSDKGAGIKSSARYVIPLCIGHEREFHAGDKSFAARYGLDLEVEAARVEQCWSQIQEDGLGD